MLTKLRMIALAACLASSLAQAQNYTKFGGTNLDFYFDLHVVGSSAVMVNGDLLTLTGNSLYAPNSFIVVPHGNFLLSNYVNGDFTARFGYGPVMANGDMMMIQSDASTTVSSGAFKNGAFTAEHNDVASAGASMSQWVSAGGYVDVPIDPCDYPDPYYGCSFPVFVPNSGTLPVSIGWDGHAGKNDMPGYFSNAIQVTYSTYASGDGGSVDADHMSFSFDGVAAAVPEPETYALLLSGLGLIAYSARRKAGGRV